MKPYDYAMLGDARIVEIMSRPDPKTGQILVRLIAGVPWSAVYVNQKYLRTFSEDDFNIFTLETEEKFGC